MTADLASTETLTCSACGFDWQRRLARGVKPIRCPDCQSASRKRRARSVVITPRLPKPRDSRSTMDPAGLRLAAAVTTYRLAIEEATSALRLGRPKDALAALERVAAPARAMNLHTNGRRS